MTDRGRSSRAQRARVRRQRGARLAAVVGTVVLLMTLASGLRLARERGFEAGERETRAAYIPPGALLRRAGLSFDLLLADVFWIRAVQHFGRARLAGGGEGRYGQLQPLLDAATTLDPRFNIAYRFGAIHYWWLREYGTAASWFQRAAETPGSPWWLSPLAANTFAIGGSRGSSRALWRQLHATSGDAWVRAEARRRLLQLEALDQIGHIAHEVEQFSRRAGRPPSAWRDLSVSGPDGVAPLDPAGHPYLLDALSGTVSVSPRSPLFPLPGEPTPAVLP